MTRIRTILGVLKWPILVALAVSIVVGILAWWLVKPAPRATLNVKCDRMVYSPNGATFVTSYQPGSLEDNPPFEICVWKSQQCEKIRQFQIRGELAHNHSLAFSPDGEELAALFVKSPDEEDTRVIVRVWNTGSGKKVREISWHDGNLLASPGSIFFTGDGKLVGFRRDDSMYEILDLDRNKMVHSDRLPKWRDLKKGQEFPTESLLTTIRLSKHFNGNWGLVLDDPWILPDHFDRCVVSQDANTLVRFGDPIEVWDVRARKRVNQFASGLLGGTPNFLSADGKIIVYVSHGHEPADRPILEKIQFWIDSRNVVQDIVFKDVVRVVALPSGRLLAEIPAEFAKTTAILAPDNKTVAVVFDDKIEFWDIPPRKPWGKIIMISAVAAGAMFALILAVVAWRRWRLKRFSASPRAAKILPNLT